MRKSTFAVLCCEGALLSFNVAACAAIVPSIARDCAVPLFIAGRAVWVYMLAYGVAALVYGPLVRVYDARRIELIFFALFTFANLYAGLSPGITHLLVARFLMGLFGASVIPLIMIMIAAEAPERERGRFVGVFFSATFVASLAGLLLSGIVPWRLIFFIPAGAGGLLWVFMYRCLPSFRVTTGGPPVKYAAALKDRRILSLIGYILCVSVLYHGVQQWLGVYFAQRYHYGQFAISMLMTLTSLSGIFGEVIGGAAADALGRHRTVKIGLVSMTACAFLLIVPMPAVLLGLVLLAWGMGWTFNHAGMTAMLTDLPKRFVNEAASLNSSVRFLAGGLGVALSSLVMSAHFEAGFAALGTGLALVLTFSRRLAAEQGSKDELGIKG